MASIADDIKGALKAASSQWTKQKKSEERAPSSIRYRKSRMTAEPRVTQKDAAWEVMEECYMAASANDTLPAHARQVFYQARPKIEEMTDGKELDYGYFSQTLLPDYIAENCLDWDVVYDARGHAEEPHTNRQIECGTIDVRNYLNAITDAAIVPASFSDPSVETIGPSGAFGAVLYIEKQGFGPLFKAVDLANRFDLMIISNKGQSVTAARHLVDQICGENDIPLFTLTDFDFAGFQIRGVFSRSNRRYEFKCDIKPISLGLRLEDIDSLEREPAAFSRMTRTVRAAKLRENGATEEEISILLDERVELNALTSEGCGRARRHQERPPACATSRLRSRAGDEGAGHQADPGLSRPPQHPHTSLYTDGVSIKFKGIWD